MADLFFRASEDALDNITAAFDISHPLRASFRYTRKVLNELNPDPNNVNSEVCNETINDDGYVHGVNYKRAFFDTSFEDQEDKLVWFLLNNLFAIHEGWVERVYSEIFDGTGYSRYTFAKNLEYENISSKFSSYFTPPSKESQILCTSFYPVYEAKASLDFSKIDNYMLCYVFFNCLTAKRVDCNTRLFCEKKARNLSESCAPVYFEKENPHMPNTPQPSPAGDKRKTSGLVS